MKKPLFLLFTGLLLSCLIPVHTVAAQELPTQKETLENIIKVNDYFMKKYADYTKIGRATRLNSSHTQKSRMPSSA